MHITDTIVIGAGQAGLAVSRCLTDHGRDHVVLERGRIGQRWRSDTWDSLHLLTPNWMNTLPGETYRGADPDGFSSAAAFNSHLTSYAESFGAPVEEHSGVHLLRKRHDQFEVVTGRAAWVANNVIIATGWCDRPAMPAAARALPADVYQVVPSGYGNPGSLPDGGVLVVGASATGVQLADELRAAGRDVTIAVAARAIGSARRQARPPAARPHHPAGGRRPSGRPGTRDQRPSGGARHRPACHGRRR